MRSLLFLVIPILAVLMFLPFSVSADPSIPLASGTYVFQHRFAEQPDIQGTPLRATIHGSHIVIVNSEAADPFPAGIIAEGRLMWHARSGQWIIGHKATDRKARNVGGCSGGPEVVDLAHRVYWTC